MQQGHCSTRLSDKRNQFFLYCLSKEWPQLVHSAFLLRRGLRKEGEHFQDVSQCEFLAIPTVQTVPCKRSFLSFSLCNVNQPRRHRNICCIVHVLVKPLAGFTPPGNPIQTHLLRTILAEHQLLSCQQPPTREIKLRAVPAGSIWCISDLFAA